MNFYFTHRIIFLTETAMNRSDSFPRKLLFSCKKLPITIKELGLTFLFTARRIYLQIILSIINMQTDGINAISH